MSPLERYVERCCTPYDDERNNCAHAALYALQGYWRAELAFSYAMARNMLHWPILRRTEIAANLSGCDRVVTSDRHAGPLGFGVANLSIGHAVVLRANGSWWARGKTGAVRVADWRVLSGWSAE